MSEPQDEGASHAVEILENSDSCPSAARPSDPSDIVVTVTSVEEPTPRQTAKIRQAFLHTAPEPLAFRRKVVSEIEGSPDDQVRHRRRRQGGAMQREAESASVHSHESNSSKHSQPKPASVAARKRWHILQSYAALHGSGVSVGAVEKVSVEGLRTPARVFATHYRGDDYVERDGAKLEDVLDLLPSPGDTGATDGAGVTWLHFTGAEHEVVGAVCAHLRLHHLAHERIVDLQQRPKFEEDRMSAFFQLKNVRFQRETGELEAGQLSILLVGGCVLSFAEHDMTAELAPIIASLRAGGRIRRNGGDFLAYSLFDCVVDQYFEVLEDFAETMEDLEEKVMSVASQKILGDIYSSKHAILMFRRAVVPLRKIVTNMLHSDSGRFGPSMEPYLRELSDHAMHVMEAVDTFRDSLTGMLDMYMSSVSNKTNEIMRVLAIVSTIFSPLTFIVGVYGMNFDYMPELHYEYSYLIAWIVMVVLALLLVIIFKKKQWL